MAEATLASLLVLTTAKANYTAAAARCCVRVFPFSFFLKRKKREKTLATKETDREKGVVVPPYKIIERHILYVYCS